MHVICSKKSLICFWSFFVIFIFSFVQLTKVIVKDTSFDELDDGTCGRRRCFFCRSSFLRREWNGNGWGRRQGIINILLENFKGAAFFLRVSIFFSLRYFFVNIDCAVLRGFL